VGKQEFLDDALKTAIKAAGGIRVLADLLGITYQAILHWKRVPADCILKIEAVTGVARERLRPDLYRLVEKSLGHRAGGLSFNDIAVVIENHNGEIEERKYSDSDAEAIFARGVDKGRAEEARRRELPPEFYDADGQPPWNQVALFCRKHVAQLHSHWEREFVTDMAGKTLWRQPSEKQAKHLLAIFIRLGGVYEPNGN
jgi:hypothetical protein